MTDPTPTDPTAAPPAPAPADPGPAAPPAEPQTDWKAEARKWERRAKENDATAKGLLEKVGQALGLTEAPTDPAALADQLAETRLNEASARLELDVYRTALRLGADADRLLDSRRFATEVDALDDATFTKDLETLINTWLTKDPSLRAGGQPQPAGPRRPVEALRSGALPAGDPSNVDMDAWMRGKVRPRP